MLMTMLSNKEKIKQLNNKGFTSKLGISVVSSNTSKANKKNNKKGIQNDQNRENKIKQSVPFRSLSVERIKRKKQKKQKFQLKRNEVHRQEILNNIYQLQSQYDELKMKRSLISQRQSQASTGKMKLCQFDEGSDSKNNYLNNSDHFISKCVPKSKIYLNKIPSKIQNSKTDQISCQISEKNQIKKRSFPQKIKFQEKRQCLFQQQKGKNIGQNTFSRIRKLDQSSQNCSLSNLKVIPIGLSITLNKINKQKSSEGILGTQKSEESRVLSNSSNHKRGINVVSNQKSNKTSISGTSVSLYVSRQLQKDKRQKQITLLKQYRGRASDDVRPEPYHYNNSQDYLRKSSEASIRF